MIKCEFIIVYLFAFMGLISCGSVNEQEKNQNNSIANEIVPYEIPEEKNSSISNYASNKYYSAPGIKLKIVESSNEQFAKTFGQRVVGSHENVVFIKNTNKIYKIKHVLFLQPKEIKITQLAGSLGVAPKVYNACVFRDRYIMEMDYAGKSLEVLVDEALRETDYVSLDFKKRLLMKKEELKKVIEKIYGSENKYNLEMVKILRKLIENNIAWFDNNPGNIIPGKPLKLIDFEGAQFEKNPYVALQQTLRTNGQYFESVFNDPNPSDEALEIKKWMMSMGVRY